MAKKILVIDDEKELLVLITKRLQDAGFEVITADNGMEGMEKARNLNPDLILLDILMPKMDGYEVCRLLKFDDKYKSIPIIILTAKTQESDKCTGSKVGADGYITKPFDVQPLIKLIKKHLGEE